MQLGLHVVDQTKINGKNITGVVVQVLRSGIVHVACKNSVLNHAYAWHSVLHIPGASNNHQLLGLDSALEGWQGMPCISE